MIDTDRIDEIPGGPKALSCVECGASKRARDLAQYQARVLDGSGRQKRITLCGRCLRDRGAAWRWRWKITGRDLDRQEAA